MNEYENLQFTGLLLEWLQWLKPDQTKTMSSQLHPSLFLILRSRFWEQCFDVMD